MNDPAGDATVDPELSVALKHTLWLLLRRNLAQFGSSDVKFLKGFMNKYLARELIHGEILFSDSKLLLSETLTWLSSWLRKMFKADKLPCTNLTLLSFSFNS